MSSAERPSDPGSGADAARDEEKPLFAVVENGEAEQENAEHADAWATGTLTAAALPGPIRTRLAELASAALGDVAAADLPSSLRAVARFAPAKRAKLGATALVDAFADSAAFRVAVRNWCHEHRPGALNTAVPDVTGAATASVLRGEPQATHYLELVTRRGSEASLRTERDTADRRVAVLEAELESVRARLSDADGEVRRSTDELSAEADRLRKRLREQGVRLRQARDEAAAAAAEVAAVRAEADAERASLLEQRDRERGRAESERERAERADADARIARQSAREARQADEVRLSLLMETLGGAVTGLRRELALGGEGPRPADTVRGARPPRGGTGRVENPAALDRLLALPAVHLVVDGYNVTKTGYPDLALADQRDRLIHQLAALVSRTGAEVTLVFDGAGVVSVPGAAPRGVRVLFSDPGVLADDVIRALVAAEPEGRPVVVVSSDREVADAVRRRGAHPVPSTVLLARLGRV